MTACVGTSDNCQNGNFTAWSFRTVIQKSKVKKITPKKYGTKEFSFLCLPNLNYCIVIVSVRLIKSDDTRATPPLDFYLLFLFSIIVYGETSVDRDTNLNNSNNTSIDSY
jgi:hypothetical protein